MPSQDKYLDGIRLVTRQQLPELTGIGYHTLKMMEYAGKSPPPVRFGRIVYYRLRDVEAWIESRTSGGEDA